MSVLCRKALYSFNANLVSAARRESCLKACSLGNPNNNNNKNMTGTRECPVRGAVAVFVWRQPKYIYKKAVTRTWGDEV